MLEFPFQIARAHGERVAQSEVEQRHKAIDQKWLEGGIGQDLPRPGEFAEAHDGGQRRALEKLDEEAHRRLLVRPGLTGLWQVSGRSDLTWEESVRLDLFYIDNWSVISDVAILGRTGSAVFNGKGAY